MRQTFGMALVGKCIERNLLCWLSRNFGCHWIEEAGPTERANARRWITFGHTGCPGHGNFQTVAAECMTTGQSLLKHRTVVPVETFRGNDRTRNDTHQCGRLEHLGADRTSIILIEFDLERRLCKFCCSCLFVKQ